MAEAQPPSQGPIGDQDWKSIETAMNRGLPETAIQEIETLLVRAQNAGDEDAIVRLLSSRATLQAQKQGGGEEERIVRLQAELTNAPPATQPMLQAMLANWFWNYYQDNQWRFRDRTDLAAAEGATDPSPEPTPTIKSADDLKTWTRQQIMRKAAQLFETALTQSEKLKSIPIETYDALLVKGTAPDNYRPTLYDFVVAEALDYFVDAELTYAGPADRFELEASSPIFASLDQFLDWSIPDQDPDSPLRHACKLYQQWLTFHRDDEDAAARLDIDLSRLQFARDHAVGTDTQEQETEALRRFVSEHAAHPISARAWLRLAQIQRNGGDLVEAHRLAVRGQQAFPESFGGRGCAALIEEIEHPSLQLMTERIWNPSLPEHALPEIEIVYKNLTEVHFRLIAVDLDELLRRGGNTQNWFQQDRAKWLAANPIREWSVTLDPTDDYEDAQKSITPELNLPLGHYLLLGSSNRNFTEQQGVLAMTDIWVSRLSLVTEAQVQTQAIGGYLLDGQDGNPITGATVQLWTMPDRRRGQNSSALQALPSLRTDANGRFDLPNRDLRGVYLVAKHHGDTLMSRSQFSTRPRLPNIRDNERSVFFTDRAIYRPGQTVRYKAICIRSNHSGDEYKTIDRRSFQIELVDANGKVIADQLHQTNELGSCHGSFELPSTGLTGRFSLRVRGGPGGATSFRVEEYKRPKFEVKVNQPVDPVRLDQNVLVEGKATAYSGASIDGAKVKYKVLRTVRYPIWYRWCCWWMPPSPNPDQVIVEGETTTDALGKFKINFNATADASVDRESEPTFEFRVEADVIDGAGETRSDQTTVRVGYTTMSAELSLAATNWLTDQEPIELIARTQSLGGQPLPAEVTVKIFALQPPERIGRRSLSRRPYAPNSEQTQPVDASDPNSWPEGEVVVSRKLSIDASGQNRMAVDLQQGHYRAKLSSLDSAGNAVTALLPLQVLAPDQTDCDLPIANVVAIEKPQYQPGETMQAVWGSGYDRARALVEVEHRGKILQRYWTPVGQTQVKINQRVDESMRGGFVLRTMMVRENRVELFEQVISVPWTNKQLDVRWERFVSKLKPGAEATWTAVIRPVGGDTDKQLVMKTAAEMVASLYDASLDVFARQHWQSSFNVFYRDRSTRRRGAENSWQHFRHYGPGFSITGYPHSLTYRHFRPEVDARGRMRMFGMRGEMAPMAMAMDGGMGGGIGAMADESSMDLFAAPAPMARRMTKSSNLAVAEQAAAGSDDSGDSGGPSGPSIDLSGIPPRKNLNETAFFFPDLRMESDGTVKMQFTMPEALTRWRLLGFAHTADLASGLIEDSVVTSKDLMVQPNPPRVLREGDEIELTVKVSNQSAAAQTGVVALNLASARTGDSVDQQMGNQTPQQSFDIPAGQSQSFSWRIKVPDNVGYLTYKAVGSTGRLSDGEEGYLPVLSRRILVHESIALPIRGKETKTFELEKLTNMDAGSIQHQSLQVQMTSNPSWYAVMSLPYLMKFPHECAEQTFNRLYANALARHIAMSDPNIQRVFENWRNAPVAAGRTTLDSPLLQNNELQSIALTETPWVLEAESQSEARRNVGILFDTNRTQHETQQLQNRLRELQAEDGSWPWFPGGRANEFVTIYLMSGYGRLRHLGVELDMQTPLQSLSFLDDWMKRQYERIKPERRDEQQISSILAIYLYGRTFFLQDRPVANTHQVAFDYWVGQAAKYWLQLPSRMNQGQIAIALHRLGQAEDAAGIVESLRQRAVKDDSGMHWNDGAISWWWYQAPIESQAMMIEMFDEVAADRESVEACQEWLLRQKETNDWETTKATADAVYALLLRGTNLLADNTLVEMRVGETDIEPNDVESGTGFYQQTFTSQQVTPEMGTIAVTKTTPGIAWGGVHWKFFQNIEDITPHDGTPLEIEKQLFVVRSNNGQDVLQAIDDGLANGQPLEVGDEVVSRLIVRASQTMEFIHLKDARGSGTEPQNVLSGYRFQDGLGYYQSTKDSAEHFFIDWLPKGTYVLESRSRVQLRGRYQSGLATIESMYAPQYNSHSESHPLEVK